MVAVYKDIDLSFKKHPISKDVLKKTDVDAVKQSLKTLFMISPLEKPFEPNFGIGLQSLLFENMSPPLVGIIQRKIKEQIYRFEPRCIIDDIAVNDDYDKGVSITLSFHVIGNSATQSFNFVLERTR